MSVSIEWGRRELLESGLPQLREPFRGSPTDYCRQIVLGHGYNLSKVGNLCRDCREKGLTECRHFEIDTCRQLIGPFQAMADPNVQLIDMRKATQTLGSLFWDMGVHFLLVHSHYSRIISLLENEEKALVYCDSRFMDTLKKNPDLMPVLPTGVKRHDDKKTDILFRNGKLIRVCGLNESNASSLTWQVVIISEFWQHGRDGLLFKAIDRAKQVADKKIILESQAGLAGDDEEEIWKRCRQVPVTWTCPFCGRPQNFSTNGPTIRRPDDFKPSEFALIKPMSDKWDELFRNIKTPEQDFTSPKPGTYAGLKTPKSSKEIKDDADLQATAAQAYLECFHCGIRMADTQNLRYKLMESYSQEYQDVTPYGKITPPGLEVGFWNPEPVSVTVKFSETMQAFVTAIKSSESGNYLPLQIFYQSRWAKPWNPSISDRRMLETVPGSYETDPAKMMPDFFARYMGVDSQKRLDVPANQSVVGSFWYVIREFDKFGNSRQLARGFADSWDSWISEQKKWKVPNARVAIDASWMTPQIERRAASEYELLTSARPNPQTGQKYLYASCWKLFFGSPKSSFRVEKKLLPISQGYFSKPYYLTDVKNRTWRICVEKFWWSNFQFEQQLDALLSHNAGMPRFEILPRDKSSSMDKETGVLTYDQQISARYPQKVRGVDKYVDIVNRKAHYRDCELEILGLVSRDNLLGHVGTEQTQ
ncbi:MAG: phage terminase large subunit family protein [Patescibacteria group bacterium]|nr:phage terminase large subunit family protein [Patescibacteria group bacterium]